MKRKCILRVQFVGDMWRVLESLESDKSEMYEYRIMHNRRVFEKFKSPNGRRAIEQCLRYALGCGIDICWREVL